MDGGKEFQEPFPVSTDCTIHIIVLVEANEGTRTRAEMASEHRLLSRDMGRA